MPANWYIPSSAQATLTVGVAVGEIGDFRVPPAAELGDTVGSATDPLSIGVRNVGSLSGTISLRIRDLDGETIWTGSITLAIDEWGWVYPAPAYTMPNRDLRLRAEAYRGLTVDSYFDRTIMLIVRVDTETTLTLDPPSIEPGGSYHYTGKLTRIDTGAGIASMAIEARRYEAGSWEAVGSGTTNANGNYDITVVAPATIGEYNCMAVFPGVVPFAASSAQARLGVGMVVLEPIWAVASAILGMALVMLGYSK